MEAIDSIGVTTTYWVAMYLAMYLLHQIDKNRQFMTSCKFNIIIAVDKIELK